MQVVSLVTCLVNSTLFVRWAGTNGARWSFPLENLRLTFVMLLLGGLFFALFFSRLLVKEFLPSFVFAPLYRLQMPIVVLVAIFYLHEEASVIHTIGLFCAFVPLILVATPPRVQTNQRRFNHRSKPPRYGPRWIRGAALMMVVVALAACLQLSTKVLTAHDLFAVPPLTYAMLLNIGTLFVGLILLISRTIRSRSIREPRLAIVLGLAAGLVNAVTLLSLAVYLVDGRASVIYPAGAMSLFIPMIAFGYLGTEPRPSPVQILSITLATAATLLLMGS